MTQLAIVAEGGERVRNRAQTNRARARARPHAVRSHPVHRPAALTDRDPTALVHPSRVRAGARLHTGDCRHWRTRPLCGVGRPHGHPRLRERLRRRQLRSTILGERPPTPSSAASGAMRLSLGRRGRSECDQEWDGPDRPVASPGRPTSVTKARPSNGRRRQQAAVAGGCCEVDGQPVQAVQDGKRPVEGRRRFDGPANKQRTHSGSGAGEKRVTILRCCVSEAATRTAGAPRQMRIPPRAQTNANAEPRSLSSAARKHAASTT